MEDVNKLIRKKDTMDLIKKYKIVIVIVTTIIIVVLFRSLSYNHFQDDASKLAIPSVLKTNIITIEKSWTLGDDILLICLDKSAPRDLNSFDKTLIIAPDSLLNKRNIKAIRHFKGSVLLFSQDISVSSRVWMLLSQMGSKSLYILTSEPDNEVRKHNFRSDTVSAPEV